MERSFHINALEILNERFYKRYADAFHSTRGHGWRGWRALLNTLEDHPLRVIDIGCGTGRLADCLERIWVNELGRSLQSYIGLERSEELLKHADDWELSIKADWRVFDWSTALFTTQKQYPIDQYLGHCTWVTLFGVMHHVYSFEARVEMIVWAAGALKKGGAISVSLWDFGADPRYEKKFLQWDHFITKEKGLSSHLIEEGDYLLGWAGEEHTPRYCHWISRDEETRWLSEIAKRAPQLSKPKLTLVEGDQNRYWTSDK